MARPETPKITKTCKAVLVATDGTRLPMGEFTLTEPAPGPTLDDFADAAFKASRASLARLVTPQYRLVVIDGQVEQGYGLDRWIKLVDGIAEQERRLAGGGWLVAALSSRSASAHELYLRVDSAVIWRKSDRFDRRSLPLADRHYNRQKVGSPQFVPPGRCLVFRAACDRALWVTSWPFARYVRHAWAGAWVNSLFRSEGAGIASELIRDAVSATKHFWTPPELGMVSFVDPKKVKPTMVRGKPIYGFCYLKAGFRHVGYTKGGLWAWQMLPHEMPPAKALPMELEAA